MRLVLAVVLASGCGRLEFSRLPDSSASPDEQDSVGDELLLHFEFDTPDPRVDSARVAHPGACTACPTIATGRVGAGAASFASSQCLEVPGSRALQPTRFTLAAWAQPRRVHHGTAVGRARDGATTNSNSYEIWMEGQFLWNISIHAARASGALTPGVWHHYASTYDGREVAAYVDGVLIASRPAASMAYTLDDVTIGCDLNNGALNLRFDGMVDDVRLYARALPPAEIAALAAL